MWYCIYVDYSLNELSQFNEVVFNSAVWYAFGPIHQAEYDTQLPDLSSIQSGFVHDI